MPNKLQHILFFLIVIITLSIVAIIGLRIENYKPCSSTADHYEFGLFILSTFKALVVAPLLKPNCIQTEYLVGGSYIIPVDLILLDLIVIAGFGIVVIKRRRTIIEQEFKRK